MNIRTVGRANLDDLNLTQKFSGNKEAIINEDIVNEEKIFMEAATK